MILRMRSLEYEPGLSYKQYAAGSIDKSNDSLSKLHNVLMQLLLIL